MDPPFLKEGSLCHIQFVVQVSLHIHNAALSHTCGCLASIHCIPLKDHRPDIRTHTHRPHTQRIMHTHACAPTHIHMGTHMHICLRIYRYLYMPLNDAGLLQLKVYAHAAVLILLIKDLILLPYMHVHSHMCACVQAKPSRPMLHEIT